MIWFINRGFIDAHQELSEVSATLLSLFGGLSETNRALPASFAPLQAKRDELEREILSMCEHKETNGSATADRATTSAG
jgi:hypothetical protein